MPRNLDKRIELLVPVEDEACRARLIDLLTTCLADTVKGRRLQPDGSYTRPKAGGKDAIRSQEALYEAARKRAAEATKNHAPVFVPHRPAKGE